MGRPHEKLKLWQEAMRVAEKIYIVTETFPAKETYGLTSQMRRSAISIPSNIAEGAARGTRKEYLQFLLIARGSLSELETQLELACRLNFFADSTDLREQLNSVFGLLNGLIKSLRQPAGS
jgi:four helix bundle protein